MFGVKIDGDDITVTVPLFREDMESYQDIAEEFQPRYEHQIVLAFVDGNHLRELRKRVEKLFDGNIRLEI